MSSQFPYFAGLDFQGSATTLAEDLIDGNYQSVLTSDFVRKILEPKSVSAGDQVCSGLTAILKDGLQDTTTCHSLLLLGHAALQAFLQSNVTGPPLDWKSSDICLPGSVSNRDNLRDTRQALLTELSEDGEAVYKLTPHIELFYLAKRILSHDSICGTESLRWARVRVNFWHQRLLSDNAASLQDLIYNDLAYLDGIVLGATYKYDYNVKAKLLLERAVIHIQYGFENKAREDLAQAAELRGFEYVLTGRLGKRTKFQHQEISQLVILAKSKDTSNETTSRSAKDDSSHEQVSEDQKSKDIAENKPKNIDLNDDTLLEAIAFSEETLINHQEENIPPSLAALDPSKQPLLDSLDSINLLLYASSITNTSPEDGLTREETIPYATRALDGGSSNWQVYTQALLVRSRIEGYKSRTVERGLLQMQALVDQVIADTTGTDILGPSQEGTETDGHSATTFLPRAKAGESASAKERLMFINQLSSLPRWSLEAELAARWVSLGGLRTALEIYERLEMWPEVAMCWAATDREDKARHIVRKQLYLPGQQAGRKLPSAEEEVEEQYYGTEREPLPGDAPRLFCMLGDLEEEHSIEHYERSWETSNHRYSRAQRSLGKLYLKKREFQKSEDAYALSLKANPQNAATWFTLGCARLELRKWREAVNAFSRTVATEPEDGEAWSNLAAALLRLPPDEQVDEVHVEDGEEDLKAQRDPQQHAKEAFIAFKRAATLKRDSYRIWQNVLNVAATLSPPPYADVIVAQQRLIELRGATDGEDCIDIEVMEGLLNHVVTTTPQHTSADAEDGEFDPTNADQRSRRHGLERTFTELLTKQIVPLITRSRRLWKVVARLWIHLNRPSSALDAYEKAWRLTLNQPGWDDGSSAGVSLSAETSSESTSPAHAWKEVEEATVELADAYESLGEREVTEGLKAGTGELVCKNWRYKARMAVRSVVGRRNKAGLDDTGTLHEKMNELRSGRGGS